MVKGIPVELLASLISRLNSGAKCKSSSLVQSRSQTSFYFRCLLVALESKYTADRSLSYCTLRTTSVMMVNSNEVSSPSSFWTKIIPFFGGSRGTSSSSSNPPTVTADIPRTRTDEKQQHQNKEEDNDEKPSSRDDDDDDAVDDSSVQDDDDDIPLVSLKKPKAVTTTKKRKATATTTATKKNEVTPTKNGMFSVANKKKTKISGAKATTGNRITELHRKPAVCSGCVLAHNSSIEKQPMQKRLGVLLIPLKRKISDDVERSGVDNFHPPSHV